jgi:hypothetical protein
MQRDFLSENEAEHIRAPIPIRLPLCSQPKHSGIVYSSPHTLGDLVDLRSSPRSHTSNVPNPGTPPQAGRGGGDNAQSG